MNRCTPLYIKYTTYCVVWASLVAQMVKNLPAMQETPVQSPGQKDPWRRKWQPTPVFLPGKSHRQSSLVGYSPWVWKESDAVLFRKLHSIFNNLWGKRIWKIYIYVYIYTHIYMCIYIYTHIYTYIYTHRHIYITESLCCTLETNTAL